MRVKLSTILIIAFVFRLLLLLVDQLWFRLPQGGVDTENFDRWAYNIYLNHPYTFLETLSNGVYAFSSLGALIYTLFGREPFVWAFVMLLFGVGTVYYTYKVSYLLTSSRKVAKIAAWIIALYPNIAILSVLVLRESPIQFFTIGSIYYMSIFLSTNSRKSLISFFLFALGALILHSAMIGIIAGFTISISFFSKKINIFGKVTVLILALGGLYFINSAGIGLSKFGGSLEGAVEMLEEGINSKESGARYPEWLLLSGGISDLWKTPIRIIAFLFSPLIPFLVKSASHLIGLIDALAYIIPFYFIYKKRILFRSKKNFAAVFVVIIVLSTAYSLGSSNFGTNIRHRAKILPLIVVVGVSAKYFKPKTNKK